MADEQSSSQLVVVGSSAGGIEALSTLVSTLPTDPAAFPAPIVIAQHLDPSRPSHLGEILARRSPLPVVTVHQHEPLLPGNVYVVPSNHHVQITDHDITLLSDGEGRPKPSVDLLLSSASEIYGERLVALILTGTGSDGAMGARAVKQAGGTVIIQNPATAAYPGMPQALEPQTVDIVADLPRIGPILTDLLTGVAVPRRADAERELQPFLERVRERTGIDFNAYKTPTILRRLQRRIIAINARDLAGYTAYLETHPDEYQKLANSFLIKVTDFMRDSDLFEFLQEKVLPDLFATSRKRDHELRLWSAGCATGEEAYSLAILIMETLGDDMNDFDVKIFATDLDGDAVAFARRGLYPSNALTNVPEELVARYFTHSEDGYEIRKQLRSLVVFGEHDLAQRAPFPRIDMVLCRNVLIYFTKELQRRALQIFAFALREGGYLALGKTETVSPMPEFFAPESPALKIYRRQGSARPATSFVLHGYNPPPKHAEQRRQREVVHKLFVAQQESLQIHASKENLLHHLPIGVVVVDRRYDIQEINNAARRMLGIHTVAIGEDLVHLAHTVPNKAFRTAIDHALREKTVGKLKEVHVPHPVTGEATYLQIECYPQPASRESKDAPVERVLVLVSDITDLVQSKQDLEEASARRSAQTEELAQTVTDLRTANASLAASQEETSQASVELDAARRKAEDAVTRHARQMEMLAEANRDLLAANEELTTANSDLRSRLDDFLVTSEEAQAAIEEIETLNEEMQATNEELETLNEELQATIEELNTSNADLAARGDELQDLAASLAAEQQVAERRKEHLEAILAGLSDAVLVISPDGERILANDAYRRLFGPDREESEAHLAISDEQGRALPADMIPQARAARGETFSMTFTVAAGEKRRWMEAVGQPTRGEEGEQWGVMVVRDITERSLRLLQEEFISLASHELRTPLTTVKGYLQMMDRHLKGDEDERFRHYIKVATTQANRLLLLINDLLDTARLQSGKFSLQREPVRLDTLLEQTVEIGNVLADSQEVRLTLDDGADGKGESGEPLVIEGDPARLQQVVLNLLTNAITHASGSKHIDVRLRRVDSTAEIDVQDYGEGIKEEHLSQLFSRFYQIHQGGSTSQGLGLGLFIAKGIVAAHGGTISVDSIEGEGATFIISLPLLDGEGNSHPTHDTQ